MNQNKAFFASIFSIIGGIAIGVMLSRGVELYGVLIFLTCTVATVLFASGIKEPSEEMK